MSDRNERARAALRGEWLPGMVDTTGHRIDRLDDEGTPLYVARHADTIYHDALPADAVPDLDDPVTELALIAVIEARVGAPVGVVWREETQDWVVRYRWHGHYIDGGWGWTRKDALIAALEAT